MIEKRGSWDYFLRSALGRQDQPGLRSVNFQTRYLFYFHNCKQNNMPSGNGARAAQKRERNAKKQNQQKSAKSQLKVNEAARTVVCKVCLTSFMSVSSKKMLSEHAENRHPKNTFAVRDFLIKN